MISEQAQIGIDDIFKNAVTANITVSPDDTCKIEPMHDAEEICEHEFSILTISSTSFRLMTLFYFNRDDATKKHFIRGSDNVDGDDHAFSDAFMEYCNICCGVMNRVLNKNYPYLGMSTPYVLLTPCLHFISSLEPGYVKHFRITINDSLILHATLCVCDYGSVDFTVDSDEAEESTGELELF